MRGTARSSAEGNYCGRAVHGVSNLSFDDLRQIEAHRAKDRPTPWAHLALRYGVNEIDLRAMFMGLNDNAEPVLSNPPPVSLKTRSIATDREARFAAMWKAGTAKDEIAYQMAMTSSQMDRMRVRLGLEKRKESAKPNGWSDAEDAYVLRHYVAGGEPAAVVGKALGRTEHAVVGRAHRKGWTRKMLAGEQDWNTARSTQECAA